MSSVSTGGAGAAGAEPFKASNASSAAGAGEKSKLARRVRVRTVLMSERFMACFPLSCLRVRGCEEPACVRVLVIAFVVHTQYRRGAAA